MNTATTANVHDINDNANANTTADKTIDAATGKKITWWGFAWRTTTLVLLFVAAVVAVAFGMHYGIAYVAGLGLSAALSTALQYVIAIIGYFACCLGGLKVSDQIGTWFASASATAAEKKAKKSS